MSDNFEKLLQDFALGGADVQHTCFRKLIALRMHHKAINDNRFKTGLERVKLQASDPCSSPKDRLLSVATLGRIASTVKGLRSNILHDLTQILSEPLPDPDILDDVDDRSYVGDSCALVSHNWITSYAAKAVVSEESGEQARQSFLAALVKSTKDLETALNVLGEHLHSWVPQTDEPGNTVSRRLRRILTAIRAAVLETMPESGDDPGVALSNIVKASFAGVSAPTNYDALAETAAELAGVVHEMVRLRFSLAMNSSTYFALGSIQEFFPSQKWVKVAGHSKTIATVATDISEAILVLCRQGVTDSTLVRQLATASGGHEPSRERLKALAKKPGLSPEIKTWLVEGRLEAPKKTSPEVGDSRKLSDDALLADLLVDSCRFRISEGAARQQILPEFEILNSVLANELKRLLNFALGLCDAAGVIAKRRGLKLRGMPGDEEEYAPLDHELVGVTGGVRRVRIIRPVVEQVREDGVPFVVRKGLVEPLKS